MTVMTARKTEYRGVVYRSKSEAMFARWLELVLQAESECSNACFGFEYEPRLEVDRWTPDFLVWEVTPPEPFPAMRYTLIEYKPSRPTDTYVEEFRQRCERLLATYDERGWIEISRQCDCELYYGSIWTEQRGYIECISDFGPDVAYNIQIAQETEWNWLGAHEDAVRRTRFDLK
jgi:hypothetical protein